MYIARTRSYHTHTHTRTHKMRALLCGVAAAGCLAVCDAKWAHEVPLHNAARPGMTFPLVGLGTGGYGMNASVRYPECWSDAAGCGANARKAMVSWLDMGGPRIDDAASYYHQVSSGDAIAATKVKREDFFYLTKVGPALPLGYNDTLSQIETMKKELQTTYVDCLLIHWPESGLEGSIKPTPSTDPACMLHKPSYNATECRLNTWRAVITAYESGFAKSIGVSNYEVRHLQEIKDAGLPMPTINQRPFNPHRHNSVKVFEYMKEHKIVFNGYSPLGTPDIAVGGSRGAHSFPSTVGTKTLLEEPIVKDLAAARGVTAGQILLAWSFTMGVPCNPRSMDEQHMRDNIAAQAMRLNAVEMEKMESIKVDWCDLDPHWYECATRNGVCPPQCCLTPPCKAGPDGSCCDAADM